MRKFPSLSLLPLWLGLVAAPFACSDSETTTEPVDNPGKLCSAEADCEDNDPCTEDFCILGSDKEQRCQNNPADGPQSADVQTRGDCQELTCEDGVAAVENDDNDNGDDNDESDCMIPVCNSGTLEIVPADLGQDCQVSDSLFGACDTVGSCSCAPATADVSVYVDAENGTDTPGNGAGRNGCAYATLDYALSQANGEINLTDSTYNSGNATFPITLTGNQHLRCDYDYNEEQLITTITGAGTFGAGTATIVFNGTTNRVRLCIVDGGGTSDVGIAVNSAGQGTEDGFHEVRFTRVTNAATGVEVTATGDVLFVRESEIQNNTTNGLMFTGADKGGSIRDNVFSGNANDVACTDASPNLSGDSNGSPTCTGCMNCSSF